MTDDVPEREHPWPGFDPSGSLLLPLPESFAGPAAGPGFTVDGIELTRKDEFHVTLLNRKLGAKVLAVLGAARIAQCFRERTWSPRRTGDYWLIHKHKETAGRPLEAWSIVELLELPAMAEFLDELSLLSRIEIPQPFPHLTHYVRGDAGGIGIASQAVFSELRLHAVQLPD